jgi:hypothetical protein
MGADASSPKLAIARVSPVLALNIQVLGFLNAIKRN